MLYEVDKQNEYIIQYPVLSTLKEIDNYIQDINIRISQGRLPLEDRKIVRKYEEYRKSNRTGKIDFKKLMNYLLISET